MARKAKESQLWTVRNTQGQYMGNYFAFTAEQAISRVIADDNRTASTFRKSQPASIKRDGLTASIEPRS